MESTNHHTALLIAALRDNLNAVATLIPYQPNPYLLTRESRNALYVAAEHGNVDVMKALIADLGMDPNGDTVSQRAAGRHAFTALHVACARGKVDCVHFLLHVAGADPHLRDSGGRTALDCLNEAQDAHQIRCKSILTEFLHRPSS